MNTDKNERCINCAHYRKCEDWFYSPENGVIHTPLQGFICTALESEDDTVIHMHGFIDEEIDYCEMYLPKKNNGWIFEDPHKEGNYLVRLACGEIKTFYFDGCGWYYGFVSRYDVVAWRPIPKFFEEDKLWM